MKINFRKIASVAATALMLGSTVAAAAYPAPFVTSGTADGAVVVGANAASSDWSAAIDLSQGLNDLVTSTAGTTAASVAGEAAPLFTSGTKIYINDSLNAVKSALTDSDLPTILADGSFSGNVDATYTQTVTLGAYTSIVFDQIPTSSDDPVFGLAFSTQSHKNLYNASVIFNKNVNLSHADSEGQDISMFGQKFTIAAATDEDTLILLKEAEKLSLDSEANPSQEVTVGGSTYTVELVSASDTAATVKVTDSSGASDSKEISEAASKKVQGLTIAVQTADETNLKLSANIIAGAEKITLESGNAVKIGESDTVVDGTVVYFSYNTTQGHPTSFNKMTFEINAPGSDKDSIRPGTSFVDPVFGSFKLDFSGLNIPEASTSSREDIVVKNSGDKKMEVTFANHKKVTRTVLFAKNLTTGMNLEYADGRNITVIEGETVYKNGYVVVGNEDEGYLLKLNTVSNSSDATYSSDKVEFTDVFGEASPPSTITEKGVGQVTIGGKVYNFRYQGSTSTDTNSIKLDYPDSTPGKLVVYPTIETSKGAKLFFYEPILNLTLTNTERYDEAVGTDVTAFMFPDGDGYTEKAVVLNPMGYAAAAANFSVGGTELGKGTNSTNQTIGVLKYTIAYSNAAYYNASSPSTVANNASVDIYLANPEGTGLIYDPAIVIFEEKDDNTLYHAVIVTLEDYASSNEKIGVNDVIRTWGRDVAAGVASTGVAEWGGEHALYSDSTNEKEADLWGTVALVDKSASDQNKATISYPDEQVYAQIYIAEEAAAITAGATTSGGGGKVLVIKDSEASSAKDKNLVVVGGSCVNTVAATILGSEIPLCGAAFSEKTKVGAGQYLIKVVASPLNEAKTAMLVAGYNAEDTTDAAKKAKEGVTTDLGTEQVYPITTA